MIINKVRAFAPLALIAFCSVSFAQTCSSPTTISSNQTLNNLNNCGTAPGNGDTTIGTVCGSNDVTGGVHVFTWHYGGANAPSGSITVTPTAPYNPAIFVGDGADCGTAASGFCDGQSDSAGQTAETIALSGLNTANTTYFLFVASTAAGTASCGQYNLAVGTLPVQLQTFSVK